MSVYIYDDALLKKIKAWTENTNVHILGVNQTRRLFELIADDTNDGPIELPIICLNRDGGYKISNTNKKPMTYDGITYSSNKEKSLQLNAIPIIISYQIDIYAKYLKEADICMRDLIFNIINHPTIKYVIPYNGVQIQMNCNMKISSDVEDNSNIPERLIEGQFTRLSLSIEIDDAYLWDARIRDNVSINDFDGINIEIQSDDTDVIIEEIK